MFLWLIVIGALLALFTAGLLYISSRAAHFPAAQKLARGRKGLARLICLVFFLALAGAVWAVWNLMNAVVCLLHLVVFWLISDLVSLIVSKIRRRPSRPVRTGVVAMVLCVLWLLGGYVADHRVSLTTYTFDSPKLQRDVRLVQIADAHVGVTFHADGFLKYIEEINGLGPDLVVVTGDLVDDDTSRADMLGACDALGRVTAPGGVFYVYGNHDLGYYSESSRGWTGDELRSALLNNGVTVLEDQVADLGADLSVAGRKDRSVEQRAGGRMSAEDLLSTVDRGRYIVLLDHQPHDFDAEAAAGADLVLCGHTHGGQFIPIRHVGEWIGENALRYGHERRQNTDFVVTSGISNWAFQFKTGCRSEIVVIDLRPQS